MKTMSVAASREEAINKLEQYLLSNKYSQIDINRTSGVISATHKGSFFRKSHYLWLIVREESDHSTSIDLALNPHKGKKTNTHEIKELKLRKKIFFFCSGQE